MTYTEITLTATYDVRLVTLSIVIALFGSYISLDLAGQVLVAQGWARQLWLIGGTIALGISIWAMHFIGMLAYQLPIPIIYDFTIVLLSMAVSITGAGAGFFAVNRHQSLGRLAFVAGTLFVGFGIVGLHLTAMLAMQVTAVSVYDSRLMALSAVTAIIGSGSSLWLAFHSRVETLIKASGRKIGSAVLMGSAIVGMHYLAMEAVSFQGNNQAAVQSSPTGNNVQLAVVVGIATLIILILTLIASFFGQRSSARIARAEAQRQSEERFRSLVQNASDVIAVVAADCSVSYLSLSVKRILGYEPEARLGKKALELLHPEDLTKAESLWSEAHRCLGVNLTSELRLRHIDGSWRDFEVIINNLLAEPSVAGIIANCRDITERKQTQMQLSMLQRAVEQSVDGIAVTDNDGQLLFINPAWAQMHRCGSEEVLGQHFSIFHTEEQMQQEVLPFMEYLTQNGTNSGELGHKRRDGTTFPTQKTIAVLTDGEAKPLGYVGVARDITDLKQAEAKLREHAFYDPLTSLPNRALFMNRLEHAIKQAKRQEDYLFAVLFIDLDRFKVINDSLGHTFGDQLLIALAGRLATCLRPSDTAARLGGDEFTILLEEIKDTSDASRVAERIQAELRLPFVIGSQEVFTTASIGIALGTIGYDRPEDLLRDADIAMYRAKLFGKARYEIFNVDMHIQAVARLQLENELRRAIDRQEFQVYYQPIVSLKTGRIIGFEALLRWRHPYRGLVSPEEFFSVVQETELSVTIDQWVLQTACRQMHQWQLAFPANPPLTISVNFCNNLFAQANLIEKINSVIRETGLDAQSLKLEITESVIMENDQSATAMLLQLKALGLQLVIDDFGTGYSSLGRLHSFPISLLKIDRSFISHTREATCGAGGSSVEQPCRTDVGNLELVETIITLAHRLGVDVTAEGVETAEQLAQLKELNCEYGQGYFFSPALDSKATEALIMAMPQW